MDRFAAPLVNIHINTIEVIIPCQLSPLRTHSASIPARKHMRSRPRLLSLPGAIIAFCKSLRLSVSAARYPRNTARRALEPSPIDIKAMDAELDNAICGHKIFSEETIVHEEGMDADATISSPFQELEYRCKSPETMIGSPILEHWDAQALQSLSDSKTIEYDTSKDNVSAYELVDDEKLSIMESVYSAGSSQRSVRSQALHPPISELGAQMLGDIRVMKKLRARKQTALGMQIKPELELTIHLIRLLATVNISLGTSMSH
ncbi:hypothetical protein HWV62_1715 [Athelia sp. TMB]|nr:hypothetical protein HWV62_1715 [Athelia sp. TMB]